MGLGIFGAALGVGLAGVWMVAGNHSEKSEKTEVANAAPSKPAPEVAASETKIADTKPAPKVEAKPVEAKAESKPVVAETKPADEVAVRREAVHHAAPPVHAKKEVAAVAAPPAPGPDAAPTAALKLYEAGNLDGAISTAESAGATKAAAKMVQFKTVYEAGKTALANKDGGGAISNLSKALKLDEQIDQGWGKLNGEIRGQLAGLYLLAGNQAQSRGDNETAIKAFKAAQGYQPANAEARKKLQELGNGGAAKKAPAANPRSAADAAFDG
jgi:tetratricopeptide (TPR) repeat protein